VTPFEQLRRVVGDEPVAPDAVFAIRLRERIRAALQQTEGTGTATLTPYICVAGAAAAIEWYVEVFEAVPMVRYDGDDGRVGHAEVTIGGALLMLSDEYPEYGVVAPTTLGGTPITLTLAVGDCDAVWARALAAGARGERPPTDQPYGARTCSFHDPYGHRWSVQTRIADPTPEEIADAMEGFTIVPFDE
jgi:PhnB protein